MSTEHSYEAFNFVFGHDPENNLKQTVSITNDPLPEHALLDQALFQAMYQTGIPWATLYQVAADGEQLDPAPIDPAQIAAEPDSWRVSFNVAGLEATYAVLGIQTYEPYAVQLELRDWTTK